MFPYRKPVFSPVSVRQSMSSGLRGGKFPRFIHSHWVISSLLEIPIHIPGAECCGVLMDSATRAHLWAVWRCNYASNGSATGKWEHQQGRKKSYARPSVQHDKFNHTSLILTSNNILWTLLGTRRIVLMTGINDCFRNDHHFQHQSLMLGSWLWQGEWRRTSCFTAVKDYNSCNAPKLIHFLCYLVLRRKLSLWTALSKDDSPHVPPLVLEERWAGKTLKTRAK